MTTPTNILLANCESGEIDAFQEYTLKRNRRLITAMCLQLLFLSGEEFREMQNDIISLAAFNWQIEADGIIMAMYEMQEEIIQRLLNGDITIDEIGEWFITDKEIKEWS